MTPTIEVIQSSHDREVFDCGVEELNIFLKRQARQAAEKKRISTTYVACPSENPTQIIGYYTLVNYSITVPPSLRTYKNYPHPLPAIKLARLAVDQKWQKRRLGELLLVDAIKKTVEVSGMIANIGLFVDPSTPPIVEFYKGYGFATVEPNDREKLEMWLPIDACKKVVERMR